MKRAARLAGIVLAVVGFFLAGFCGAPGAQAAAEEIRSFTSDLNIQQNGLVFVSETIVYEFGSNKKRGIYRDIPLTSDQGPSLSIRVLDVVDEAGSAHPHKESLSNNVLRIKIGDPDVLVSGLKTYIIRYELYNSFRFFADHDELYWNVTGNGWGVPMQAARALVTLPDASAPAVRRDCFTGPAGSAARNCTSEQQGAAVTYAITRPLANHEGFTIVLGLPAGYVSSTAIPPSAAYQATVSAKNGPYEWIAIMLFFALPAGFIFFLKKRGGQVRKPKPVIPKALRDQPIVTAYAPPANLTPIEVGTLLDRTVDITDISSVIIDLAVRGYLKIRYFVRPLVWWPDKKDFELIKIKPGTDLDHPADKIIFDLLFAGRDTVTLNDLQNKKTVFQAVIKKIKKEVADRLQQDGYFGGKEKTRTEKRRENIFIFSVVAAGLGYAALSAYTPAAIWFIVPIVSAVVVVSLFLFPSQRLTDKGVAALAVILGFREFLKLTEAEKLRLVNAPHLQPETFEKFLPYAMVLGVEQQWAKKFEGIYEAAPSWYADPTISQFNSFVLAKNLYLFNSSFNQVFHITTPRSSSGFSGGFSGGGSGGGGGGSW